MEIKKPIITDNKTVSVIDFKDDISSLSKDKKNELLNIVGELLIERTLSSMADSVSPVDGSSFPALSKEYAKYKLEEVGTKDPNLDLTGSMINALDYKIVNNSIEYGIYGKEAGKADGHNNLSGRSNLPKRQFLPDAGEGLQFEDTINQVISDFIADNTEIKKEDLEAVGDSKDLYALLKSELGDYSKKELKSRVLRSELAFLLDDYGLLEFL